MTETAGAVHGPGSGADGAVRVRRRMVAWDPGVDTLIALATLVGFWGSYWAGTTIHPAFLYAGILLLGTLVPALTVLHRRREGLEGLGITRRHLVLSLVLSAVLGAGSAYQLFVLAAEQGVPVLPHLLGNLVVLWERAFGWLPAILLVGAGFALQHVGSVPLPAALAFGAFALAFALVYALVRNLLVLWPLFYPVASGIGTLQSGFAMGWGEVMIGAMLLLVQLAIIALVWRARRL